MFGVPAMFLFLSQLPEFDAADLTSVRTLVCGGAPVPEPLIKLFNGRGVPINQGYGLTETAPMVSFLSPEWSLEKIGSAGRAPLFGEIRVVDETNRPITSPRVNGEVCTRGPNVMKGYWRRPDATAAAIDTQGWFHTGDVGYLDDDGFLYIADRVKDMVITGGENVYPAEVEGVLYEHPGVADVAVIGIADERWGEAVVAVVAPREGAIVTLDDLRSFAGERLARYKLPTRVEVVDILPRNPAGKVLKFELRERFGSA
jgi:fatty-acyl-CoA synthase